MSSNRRLVIEKYALETLLEEELQSRDIKAKLSQLGFNIRRIEKDSSHLGMISLIKQIQDGSIYQDTEYIRAVWKDKRAGSKEAQYEWLRRKSSHIASDSSPPLSPIAFVHT